MKERKIGPFAALFMGMLAVIIDAAQALLTLIGIGFAVSPILSIVAFMFLFVTLHHHNVPFTWKRSGLRFFVPAAVETVGIGANAFPVWTISVLLTLWSNWAATISERL